MTAPTPGRIVHYRLSASDADRIIRDRETYAFHRGNRPSEGALVPLIVVQVWPDEYTVVTERVDTSGEAFPVLGPEGVNGQAFLDGNDSAWICSAPQGDGPGMWSWPVQAEPGPVPTPAKAAKA